MVLKAFSNDGDSPKWVSGRMILPGATELIEVPPDAEDEVPVELAEPAGDPQAVLLAALLENAVKDIVPVLPELSDADLAALEVLEKAGKARKGLLAEVLQERLKRAVGGDEQAPAVDAVANGQADSNPAGDETVNRDADPAEGGAA